jgi:hypothetical protein
MQAAINKDLIAAIVAHCGVSHERAAKELKAAKAAAKTLGLPLADTLVQAGLVA